MTATAEQVLDVARGWIGYSESNGKWKKILDVYNSHKPLARNYKITTKDSWCDAFVSACAIKAGATDIIGTEVSCQKHIDIFKKKGIWKEDGTITPKPGDIILYNWDDNTQPNDGNADHIGYVEKVSGNTITAIEGNKSDAVGRRTIKVGAGNIRGYARPKYKTASSSTNSSTSKKSTTEIAKEVIAGKWGNGDDRKKKLEAAGYDYETIQKKVNELSKSSSSTASKKSVTEVAKEVLNGKWGNGDARKKKLEAAGYDYEEVQKKVNELSKKSVTTVAKEVIDGKWGNGDAQKKKLEAAGYDYEEVQKKVNELL